MSRKLSSTGLELIKSFESCKLYAYKCLPSEKFYTIGYGHYGADVQKGMKITKKQADNLLLKDCEKFVKHINTYMSTYNFNQNQFDALVSFAFNIGNINQLTASGTRTIEQISSKITLYNKIGGQVISGLVKRRAKEKELFDAPTKIKNKTNLEIAKEVIAGKWGNGNSRKTALIKAGYDYKAIQSLVNEMIKG